jgi:hypothetical protein
MVDQIFQIGFHFHEFVLRHVGTLKHGFLDPGSIAFQGFYHPIPGFIVHDVETNQKEHGLLPIHSKPFEFENMMSFNPAV